MGSALKVQLNSLQILEKILLEHPQIEIELRNSVIDAFSKKHLKSITDSIADKFMGEANKIVTQIMEERIGKFESQYGNYGSATKVFKLKPEVKKEITDQIDKDIKAEIQDTVRLHLNELSIEALVGEAVGRYVTVKIGDEVKRQTDQRLKEAFKNLI